MAFNFNFLALPAELRNMIYAEYLYADLNAPGPFQRQVERMRLPVPALARANPQIRNECLAYFYGRMYVRMDIMNDYEKIWESWLLNVRDAVVESLRNFIIVGPNLCGGDRHNRIIINLNNVTTPVLYATQVPGRRINSGPCLGLYHAAMQLIAHVLRMHQQGNVLVMTEERLLQIWRIMRAIEWPSQQPFFEDRDEEFELSNTFVKHDEL